jgi:hypothetical protein
MFFLFVLFLLFYEPKFYKYDGRKLWLNDQPDSDMYTYFTEISKSYDKTHKFALFVWYHLRCIELRFVPKKPTGVAEIA